MLDNKRLKEVEKRIKHYIKDEVIKPKQPKQNVDFFMINSKDSLIAAKLLLDVSINEELQEATGYLKFNGYLWVINASYYSMFYMARALLESSGIKVNSDLSVHRLVFDALVYYFYLNGKLQKTLIELFIESKEEAAELLGKEIADKLIEDYFFEKGKRARLTYETGELAMQNKARTSVQRAEEFNKEIKRVIALS